MTSLSLSQPQRLQEPSRNETVLHVSPRPMHRPTPTPHTVFLAPKTLNRASSHDYLCEKARYLKTKSESGSETYAPPSPPWMLHASTTGRTSICSASTVPPPVPPIPTELIRPTDKRPLLRGSSPRCATRHVPATAKQLSGVHRRGRRASQSH